MKDDVNASTAAQSMALSERIHIYSRVKSSKIDKFDLDCMNQRFLTSTPLGDTAHSEHDR
jgi:hypothetical protein